MKPPRCIHHFVLRKAALLAIALLVGTPVLLPAANPDQARATAAPAPSSGVAEPGPAAERNLLRRKQFKVKKNVDSQAPEASDELSQPSEDALENTLQSAQYWKILENAEFSDEGVPPGPYPNLWGLFIGVSKYKNNIPKLTNPVHDAEDLAAAFQAVSGMQKPILLLDEEATLANVRLAFKTIAQSAGPGDLVIFHFSGHGQGFANNGREVGLLLLHECPGLHQLMKGDFSTGVLDMSSLQRNMDEAGIKAKHKLIFLDCCFGGMSTLPPPVSETGKRSLNGKSSIALDMMLNKRSTYIVTAGSAKQTVSDGQVGRRGHGLLSGLILDALRNGDELSNYITAYPSGGRKYYSTIDLYSLACGEVTERAQQKLQRDLGLMQEKGVSARELFISRDGGAGIDPITYQKATFDQLKGKIQVPQMARKEGEGLPYLPIDPEAAAAFRKQFPEDDSGPWPMTPGSLQRDLSEKEPTDTASPPAGSRPGWEEWTRQVGEKYRSPEYAQALQDLLLFLEEGKPSFPDTSSPLRINASVYARPQFSVVEKLLRNAQLPWSNADLSPGELLSTQELLRDRIRGANWRELPYVGATVTVTDEYSLRILNLGQERLVAYLIALDAAGILQWLSPSLPVNETWQGYAFGEAALAAGQAAYFPLAQEWNGQPIPIGSPVETAVDQRFILICCPQRWDQLERLLHKASSLAETIFHTQPHLAAQALNAPMQSGGVRAVGRAKFVPMDGQSRAKNAPSLPLTAVCNIEGKLFIQQWNIQVLANSQKVFVDLREELAAVP